MLTKRQKNLERAIVYGLVAVLLAVFAFTDLAISEAVADQFGNLYGIIGSLYVETPFTFLTAVCLGFLFKMRPRDSRRKNIGFGILWIFLMVCVCLYGGYMWSSYPEQYGVDIPIYVAALFGAVWFGLAYLISQKVNIKDEASLKAAAVVTIIVFLLCVAIIMTPMKMIWGRPRYRFLISERNDGYVFQPWYLINPGNPNRSDFYSFPSGHTMNITGLMCLSLILSTFGIDKSRWLRWRYLVLGLIVFGGISRVYNAAHYASDVTAGFFLTYLTVDLLETFMYPYLKGKFEKPQVPEITVNPTDA